MKVFRTRLPISIQSKFNKDALTEKCIKEKINSSNLSMVISHIGLTLSTSSCNGKGYCICLLHRDQVFRYHEVPIEDTFLSLLPDILHLLTYPLRLLVRNQ